MTKTIRATLCGLALTLGLCTITAVASAEPTKKDSNYGYKFDDDLLVGTDIVGAGQMIKVIKKPIRDRLHRPRANFVPEMLKSVENM